MSITVGEINELYAFLPAGSKAREADNHWAFQQFLGNNGTLGGHQFDNAILCRDKVTGVYTWHDMCDEYRLSQILDLEVCREGLEQRIKGLRHGRTLQCVEVVTRDRAHYFLKVRSSDMV